MPTRSGHLYDEIVRLRERVHDLSSRVSTLELRAEGMRQTLESVDQKVSALATADEIAAAVTQHDREHGRLRLTRGQKRAVLGAFGIIAANLVLRLAGVEGL